MPTTAELPFRASRYTTGAIVLHWTIALVIVLQLASGFAMVDVLRTGSSEQFALYQLHKSLGVLVLTLTVARIAWRLFNPPPAEPASVTGLERRVSGLVHAAFYALLILIPLSGWVMISVAPIQIQTVLFFTEWLPWPHIPGLLSLTEGARTALYEGSKFAHKWLAYGTGILLLLHVAGALKHHLADGEFLKRMSPIAKGDGPRNSYGHATTWSAMVVFFAVMVGSAAYARYAGTEEVAATEPAPQVASGTVSPDQASVLSTGAMPTTNTARLPGGGTEATDPPVDTAALAPQSSVPLDDPVEPAPPSRWILDPAESALTYSVDFSGAVVEGAFEEFSADIIFDPENLEASSIEVMVDTTTASVDSSEISRSNLMGADGFANDDHGTATFISETIRAANDSPGYIAEGALTIRGESVPQELPFTVDIDGDRARANGSMTIERLTYGIGADSDTSGDWLGLEVDVAIAVEADRAAGDAVVAAATGEPSGAESGAAGPAGRWQVLPESSVFYAFRMENSGVTGELPDLEAEIRFDPDNLEGSSIRAEIDLNNVVVTEGDVGTGDIKGSDGLDVARQPTAVFTADEIVTAEDGAGYVAKGVLSLKGIEEPIDLPFTLTPEGDVTRAEGTAVLSRDAFRFAEELNPIPGVGPEIEVTVRILALPPSDDAGQEAPPAVARDPLPGSDLAPPTEPRAQGPAGLWEVLPESSVDYSFLMDGSGVAGQFPDVSGEIRFDPDNLEGSSIRAEIDLGSVVVEEGSVGVRDISGPDGLDVESQQTAVFSAVEIVPSDDGEGYVAKGMLSVRGVEGPVDLPFTLTPQGDVTLAEGMVPVSREVFGFGGGPNALAAFGPDINVTVRIFARPPSGAEVSGAEAAAAPLASPTTR